MAVSQISRAVSGAALAAGLAIAALPITAHADEQRHGRADRGAWQGRQDGGNPDAFRGRAIATGQIERDPAPQQQPQAQPVPPDRRDSQRSYAAERAARQAPASQRQAQAGAPQQQRNGSRQGDDGRGYRQQWNGGQQAEGWRGHRDQQQDYRQGRDYRQGQGYRGDQNYRQGQNYRHDQRDGDRSGNWNGNGNRYAGNHNNWNREWRGNNRYDWRGYRNNHRDTYRLGRYYAPYNSWSYRRLGIGFSLEPLFYGSSFWIQDPYDYRLPPAYGPYRWVRYYDDALLVDTYTGEVVDVIYDIFW